MDSHPIQPAQTAPTRKESPKTVLAGRRTVFRRTLYACAFVLGILVCAHSAHADLPWVLEFVDGSPSVGINVGAYTSIAVEPFGVAHISYYDIANGDLKHAWRTETGWLTEVVDSVGNVGLWTSIALDRHNFPNISYYDQSKGVVKWAWYCGFCESVIQWRIEVVDTVGSGGGQTSLVLDAAGNPHVSYYDSNHNVLRYAVRASGGWKKETVAGGGFYNALALDRLGNPHISYQESFLNQWSLMYASLTGTTSWSTESVDAHGLFVGAYNSLALDARDFAHIGYLADGTLRYAFNGGDGPLWRVEQVDSVGPLAGRGKIGHDTWKCVLA
jgi:hypothetical protein